MSLWGSIKKGVKKIGKAINYKKTLPALAGIGASFIPGVGPALGKALATGGSMLGSVLGASDAPNTASSAQTAMDTDMGTTPQTDFVSVTGQRDPPPSTDWSKYIAPAAGVVGGLINYAGQKSTNTANAEQAQRQMDFQNDQTSSAYVRGTADMRAAGLNPMLAYSQGGASSGGGASATMGNSAGAGVSTALDVARATADIDNVKSTTAYTNAKTAQTEVETNNLGTVGENLVLSGNLTRSQTRQVDQAIQSAVQQFEQDAKTNPHKEALAKYEAKLRNLQAQLANRGIPKAEAENYVWTQGEKLIKEATDIGVDLFNQAKGAYNSAREAYGKFRNFQPQR
ncbi:MAG: DNA pilot protein [Microvirus sp.]|nr:MAG: DNA pilot protein [Microvirus sp.]